MFEVSTNLVIYLINIAGYHQHIKKEICFAVQWFLNGSMYILIRPGRPNDSDKSNTHFA